MEAVLGMVWTRGGYFRKNWVVVCGTLPETVTLFQGKICDFPYPISDLIKNVISYFRPDGGGGLLYETDGDARRLA